MSQGTNEGKEVRAGSDDNEPGKQRTVIMAGLARRLISQ